MGIENNLEKLSSKERKQIRSQELKEGVISTFRRLGGVSYQKELEVDLNRLKMDFKEKEVENKKLKVENQELKTENQALEKDAFQLQIVQNDLKHEKKMLGYEQNKSQKYLNICKNIAFGQISEADVRGVLQENFEFTVKENKFLRMMDRGISFPKGSFSWDSGGNIKECQAFEEELEWEEEQKKKGKKI